MMVEIFKIQITLRSLLVKLLTSYVLVTSDYCRTAFVISYAQTDAITPSIVGLRMLGVVASVFAVVCKPMRQLPTTRNNIQQGVQTDATCSIQQCCVLLHGAKDISLFSDLYGHRTIALSWFSVVSRLR